MGRGLVVGCGLLLALASVSTTTPPAAPAVGASTANRLAQPRLGKIDVDLADPVSRAIAAPWLQEARELLAYRLDVDALPDDAGLTFWLVGVDGERPRIAGLAVRGAEQGDLVALRTLSGERVTFFDQDGASLEGPMLARPVAYHRIASRLGPRENPFGKRRPPKFHAGTDYAAPIGTPIRSVADGVVTQLGYSWSAGRYVFVTHDDGVEARYLHMSKREPHLKVGRRVRTGEPLGQVGKSGRVTGPHLHFELRESGLPLDAAGIDYPSALVLDTAALAAHRARMSLFAAVREDGSFDLLDETAAWQFRPERTVDGPAPVPLRSAHARALPVVPRLLHGADADTIRVRKPVRRRLPRRRAKTRTAELRFLLEPGSFFLTT